MEFPLPEAGEALLINAYEGGQWIGRHTNHVGFRDLVAVVSIGADTHLGQCSHSETLNLFFGGGDVRWKWSHSIA